MKKALLLLLMCCVKLGAQSVYPPYYAATGQNPNGKFVTVQLDTYGNLYTNAQLQSSPASTLQGYIPPVAMTGQGPSGNQVYLKTDLYGNLYVNCYGCALTGAANTFTGAQTAPAFYPQTVSAGPYSVFFDDFYDTVHLTTGAIGSPTSDNCNESTTNGSSNHPGIIGVNSGTGGSGSGIYCVQTPNTNSVATLQSGVYTWETDVFPSVLPGTTASAYQAGFVHNTNTGNSPWTVGLGFYLSSANGVPNDWYCEYSSTYTDTTVAATLAWTRLSLVSDGTNMHWYINGTQVCGTGVALTSLNAASMDLFGYTSVTNTASTAVSLYVDYVNYMINSLR